ncbi:FAD-dependent oxidoreductase [Candidatus Solirubrobacter pratensis]|uniref:FAD-dependent oxidoreductase n=1 Tax=Candidatus Solirubrobacter pratensis TaxID=1298857 RepID=UPI00041AA5DA|nr:FAD-dependent monooxygenase [Candidatus Solirubrobacter pratensis]
MIETDVLIVGSGPAGSSSALFLSTYGVQNMVITKYRWTANTPRAHITNQRAVEIMRDMGLEGEIKAKGVPQPLMGDTVFCTSLAGDELARLHTWGTHPARLADYTLASPCIHYDLPQDIFEPIILGEAARRGTRVRFDTEYLSYVQDADGVTVTALDRLTGDTFEIRAKYLIGADGGRSKIAQDLALPMEGEMDRAGSMNIVFHADLSKYVAHRPSVLYWVMQPGADIGGIGMGLVRMVRPWDEWLIVWGYDINEPPPEVDEAVATRVVHNLVGDDTIDVTLRSTSLWGNNKMYATRYSEGRVFCMGDACHRHPPSNGLGSNTSIADAYNLAWKLALVLDGKAAPSLLDSYDAERAPIGRQIVLRANQSIDEFGPIFDALGLLETTDPEQMRANMEIRKENSPAGAEARRKLKSAIELKNYEFNAHGVELGQRYRSSAVVPDGTPEPAYERDPELYYHATTWPGARLPHAWLEHRGERVSTHDLAGKGRFTLLTGIGGEAWVEAAAEVTQRTGVPIAAFVIGPARDAHDIYDDWARLREVEELGCVLVRPDAHVAWRANEVAEDATAELSRVMDSLLGNENLVSSSVLASSDLGRRDNGGER